MRCLVLSHALRKELADEARELARILALTRADDHVMDAKGESIFRRSSVYWVQEGTTETRMRAGSIVDDTADQRATRKCKLRDRLPARDSAFVDANDLPVKPAGGLIHIAGRLLGSARAGEAVWFEIGVLQDYAVVTPGGRAGRRRARWRPVRRLAPGRHVFVPSADSRLAVVWPPALLRGLEPNELFAPIDR